MAQLEEKLGALLSDEEGRQRFLQLASMLSGNGGASSPSPDADSDSQAANNTEEEAYAPPPDKAADKAGMILEVLPKLLGALSGSGEGLDEKKLNLIRALSPYLNTQRSRYIDRAIRMASMAKAAKDTLGMLGR
ncbi:MAG: hypothetical protein J6Q16_00695 [Clostridia bacterium]|nr:hypothetical protein [Clostridia bacterium]